MCQQLGFIAFSHVSEAVPPGFLRDKFLWAVILRLKFGGILTYLILPVILRIVKASRSLVQRVVG